LKDPGDPSYAFLFLLPFDAAEPTIGSAAQTLDHRLSPRKQINEVLPAVFRTET
jgi:hypothetical protein